MENGVRQLERGDIPRVAALYMRIFRDGKGTVTQDLLSYYDKVYFSNPWLDPDIGPLVYEDTGEIIGFLGAVPRQMRLGDRVLRTAVVGSYMFDHRFRTPQNALGAVELIRRLIEGPQDLTISDTANDKSRAIWEMCGGLASHLYSFRWLYAIRPFGLARYLAGQSGTSPGSRALSLGAGLLAPPLDLAFRLAVGARSPSKGENGPVATALTIADIVEALPLLKQYALLPHYDEDSLTWLLEMAAQKRVRGELRARVVKDRSSQIRGWFVYYRHRSRPSLVLQLGAVPNAADEVFTCLLEDAVQFGAMALTGRLCPTMARYLTQRRCIMTSSVGWAVIHARDPAVIRAFDRGKAFFSSLEGEQWLRFASLSQED